MSEARTFPEQFDVPPDPRDEYAEYESVIEKAHRVTGNAFADLLDTRPLIAEARLCGMRASYLARNGFTNGAATYAQASARYYLNAVGRINFLDIASEEVPF